MKTIKISGCGECPAKSSIENEMSGVDYCGVTNYVIGLDDVHPKCPLRDGPVKLELAMGE